MDKEMLDIVNDLSKRPTTELALQIMELSGENLILEQQCKKQKEVIDKAIEYINHFSKESEVKIYGLPKCKVFIGDIEQLLDILKEVSE